MAEGSTFEYKVFEIVENGIGRAVEIRINLVLDYLPFLVEFVVGETRIEHQVGHKLDGA